jgi:hypothetical protein
MRGGPSRLHVCGFSLTVLARRPRMMREGIPNTFIACAVQRLQIGLSSG